jgi:homoserine O-acetyltransferase/O-succinyltransferase
MTNSPSLNSSNPGFVNSGTSNVVTIATVTSGLMSHEPPSANEPPYSNETRVVKRVFTLPALELEGGQTLKNVRVGYECYGNLNARGDNAILILHYFTGSSHAAGRYNASDAEPGYWDSIIGPGKAIDTNKFFVIGVDSLSNLYCRNPMVVTTGPMSINPDTGKEYGAAFPVVQMADFVNVQYSLCRFLGINSLHAVCGSSMGSMTALEWGARFPGFVQRVMGVIGGGLSIPPYLVAMLRQWTMPILIDPKFKDGNYDSKNQPLQGLAASLELVTLTALSPNWAERSFQRRSADRDLPPDASLANLFSVESSIAQTAAARASLADANSFLRLAKAVQLFDIRAIKNKLKAKILWIPAREDKLIFPEYAERGIKDMRELGLDVQTTILETDGGHLDGLNEIKSKTAEIRAFLEA